MSGQQEIRALIADAAMTAATILRWACQPDIWPAFAAFAEQAVPGDSWGEADRQDVLRLIPVFDVLVEAFDDGR